jgi:hypothetical protein
MLSVALRQLLLAAQLAVHSLTRTVCSSWQVLLITMYPRVNMLISGMSRQDLMLATLLVV